MAVGVAARRYGGRVMLPLALVFLAVGLSTSVVEPFRSLFLTTAVRADPLQVSVFLVVAPLTGVVAATLVGRLSDRRAIRRGLLVGTSLAGLVGMALTAVVRDYWVVLVLTGTAAALGAALFPQALAYARLALSAGGGNPALGVSTLRTVFSVAWVAGPPLAAVLLEAGGFAWLFGTAAAMYALAALVATFALSAVRGAPVRPPDGQESGDGAPSRARLLLTAAAFTLLNCPLSLCVQALPLYLGTDLGGDPTDAGLVLGLCAALEIPLMLGLGLLATRLPVRLLVLAGTGCGVAYFTLAGSASAVWMLAAAQPLNAAFIAAVAGLGISYMQDMLPGQPGRATTLFTNTFPVGAILAGPLFGVVQHVGYRSAFLIAAGLCATGMALLLRLR